jgi:hypothetical protein
VENNGELGRQMVNNMGRMTSDRYSKLAMENAGKNLVYLDKGVSLAKLRSEIIGDGDMALVAAAGPSIKKQDPAQLYKQADFKGALIVTESAIAYWLRNGIVPDLAVTVDPNLTRIVRWFGDPSLTEDNIREDDYFSRQDQDKHFADELKANDEIVNLLDRHGKDIRIALSTSASPAVVERVMEIGMPIYWWNPMLDDPDETESLTSELQAKNRLPCVNAGGNVGAACWMMANAVLEKSAIGVVGMDFSYYEDTPYRNTQYYYEMIDLVGEENLDSIFMRVFNPHLKSWFITDPAYKWYQENMLELVRDADSKTFNCTEGGILFGENIDFVSLQHFFDIAAG